MSGDIEISPSLLPCRQSCRDTIGRFRSYHQETPYSKIALALLLITFFSRAVKWELKTGAAGYAPYRQ